MQWEKLGVIFQSPIGAQTQCPVIEDLGQTWRIYYSSRNEDNRSNVYYFDVEANNPQNVIDHSIEPLFKLGSPGTWNCDGIMPGCIVDSPSSVLPKSKVMLLTGWERALKIPHYTSIGFALCMENKWIISNFPILHRCIECPYSTTTPYVIVAKNMYHMFFASVSEWKNINGKMESKYHIKQACSKNLIHWNIRDTAIGLEDKASCYPCVWKEGRYYYLMYCSRSIEDYKSNPNNGYKLKCVRSSRLYNWKEEPVELIGNSDWDSNMQAYPCVYKDWLFYNGNNFGKTGIGVAKRIKS